MAFVAKYTSEFVAEDGNTYQWEIREKDYVGSATDLTPSSMSHCRTRWITSGQDEFGPFIGSETTLSFYDTATDDVFGDIFGADNDLHKKYQIAITQGGSDLWVGYMEPVASSINEDGPTRITLSATCGLGRLDEFEYSSDPATGAPKEDRAPITTIIAELLQPLGFGLDIYVACDMYPRISPTQLTADNNPLFTVHAEREAFSVAPKSGSADVRLPGKNKEILEAILNRFGLIIFQAEGAWHVYAEELFYSATSFSRWKYDSTGAESGGAEPANKSTLNHAITPAAETYIRHVAEIGQLPQYNAVTVMYHHDVAEPLRNTDFSPTSLSGGRMMGRPGDEYWVTGNATFSRRVSNFQSEDEYEWRIERVTYDWVGETAANINTAIGDYTAAQETDSVYPSGTEFRMMMETYIDSQFGRGARGFNTNMAIAIQVKLNASPTVYYASLNTNTTDDAKTAEWTTTANTWVLLKAGPSDLDAFKSMYFDLPALPDDGTITVTLGPVLEEQQYTDTGGSISNADYLLWDNVSMRVIRADGQLNPTTTVVTNYLSDRDNYRGKEIQTVIGDGPQNDSRGSLTYSTSISDATGDWEEGPITGAASGDSIDDLLTRMVLRSVNRPRRTHSTTYEYTGQRLSPLYTIRRDGSNYRAKDIEYDWREGSAEGTWYRTQQTGFTDDLVSGIDSGPGMGALLRGTGDVLASFAEGLSTSFFSEAAKRITRTTAAIPAGAGTASVAVEAIAEPLLQSGDLITIIAPDLSFYQVRVSEDQAAGAPSISFDDPDNPGSNFSFAKEVAYPANIFYAEDKLLTLARLGEQGFAVTVLGGRIGTINETKSGTHTALNVTSWVVSIPSGNTVELEQTDGSFVTVTLTSDAPRGSTSIAFSSTVIDVTSGDAVRPSGSVPRAEFSVTADAITAYLGSPGGVIATLASGSTWDGANTSLPVGGSLTDALKANDPILIYTALGQVIKAEVNADVSAGATPIVLTAASGDQTANIKSGDKVVPGSLTGMRIDMNNISFTASQINSSNYSAGSAGWAILNDGSAEFNNVTVRGTLSTSSLTGVLSISGAGAVSIGSDFTIDASGLLITSGGGNVNAIRWSDGGKIESGGGPGVMTITSPGPGTGTISMIGTGVVLNVGYARLIDVSAATSAPGQAGAASLFSLAGELYTRNGTGSHYVLLNSNSTVQVSKLSAGTNGYVLTMVGGVPAWAASAAGTTTFTGLTDTPASFAGSGSYLVRVNAGATALEFVNGSTIFQPLDTQLTHIAALAPTAQVELVTMNNSGAYLSSGSDGQFLKMAFGSPSWHDTTAITAVGTITTGTWQGTAIGDTYISSAATWNAKLSDITGEPLSDLSDVTITSIASGELLKWNGSAWVNNTLSEAGIQGYNTNLAQISSISPTNGGMIYYASGAYSQLAAGANGYILRMSLGTPGWEALSGISVSEFNDNGTYIRADVADSVADVITFNAGPKFEAGILLDHESGDLSGTAGYHTLWARSTGERLDYISGTGNVHSIVTNRKGVVNLYSRYGQTTVTGTTPVNFFADSGSFVGTSSVPASVVQAGSVFRIKAMGTRQGNASDSHTWTLRLGAVTLWSYTYTPANSFGGYLGWELDAMISVVTTGAGGTIWVQGVFQDDAGEQQFIQNTATDTYNTTSGASMQLNVNTNTSTTATCEIAIIDLSRSLSTAA